MRVKRLVIDGFKSYGRRTVLEDFDASFNAITGLNGSGKSNILDAICFVLGITQLSHVRVSNLKQLVYKQGQAGVTKASVSVVFDNRDKSGSPLGYEAADEITVTRQITAGTGKNKYLVNGRNASGQQVAMLFHTVSLNVNNPHFLIMQGRITKVLNMKPPEILGMVAEAAGTSMYDAKRKDAVNVMGKKERKVAECKKMLAEDITPTLEKLKLQQNSYDEWNDAKMQSERLERVLVAFDYMRAEVSVWQFSLELLLGCFRCSVEYFLHRVVRLISLMQFAFSALRS